MFTPKQEEYLTKLADNRLAEEAEIQARNEVVFATQELLTKKEEALKSLKDKQEAEYQTLVSSFDEQISQAQKGEVVAKDLT